MSLKNYILPAPALISLLLLAGMFFNAGLAIVNANIMSVSTAHVIMCEALILGLIALVAFPQREKSMQPWVIFSCSFVVIFIFIMLVNAFLGQTVSPKPLRDIFLISAFAILGICFHKQHGDIVKLFRVVAIMVSVVLIFENYASEIYGRIFDVAKYYINTRGIEDTTVFGLEGNGLFINTQLQEGRFTLGFLTTHRLSSLFLEQTTLGNFAAVLAMFTGAFWGKLKTSDKTIFISAIILSIMGTDSRLALGGVCIAILGYFVFPHVPRKINILYVPILIILAIFLFYDPYNNMLLSDDLGGRYSWSLTQMANIDWLGYLGGRPNMVGKSMDSGYSYFIYAQSIIGAALFWLFTSLIMPQNNIDSRRYAHMISAFIAINLMVGPTLLSIKTAAMVWFIAGYIYHQSKFPHATPLNKENA